MGRGKKKKPGGRYSQCNDQIRCQTLFAVGGTLGQSSGKVMQGNQFPPSSVAENVRARGRTNYSKEEPVHLYSAITKSPRSDGKRRTKCVLYVFHHIKSLFSTHRRPEQPVSALILRPKRYITSSLCGDTPRVRISATKTKATTDYPGGERVDTCR